MNPIFAKTKLILKNGYTIDYRCITQLEVKFSNIEGKFLYITGESDNAFGGPRRVYDKHFTKDINILITEFYEPK